MALRGLRSWDALAELTSYGLSTVKDLGTPAKRVTERHLREIATACDLPYAWFTVASIAAAIEREDDDPSVLERMEALEKQISVLFKDRRDPPTPPDDLLGDDAPT